jgi:hypothetical protein
MPPRLSSGLSCVGRLLSTAMWVLPLVLCVGFAWVWARSYRAQDVIRWSSLWNHGAASRQVSVRSSVGRLGIAWDRLDSDDRTDGADLAGLSLPWGPGLRWETTADPAPIYPTEQREMATILLSGGAARTTRYDYYDLIVPLWPLLVVAAVLPVWNSARRLFHWLRRRPGYCHQCGYDLRGCSERCSKCGRPIVTGQPVKLPRPGRRQIVVSGLVAIYAIVLFLAARTAARPTLSDTPCWLPLGGNTYQEGEVNEAEKQVLKIGTYPEWFNTMGEPVSQLEFDAYLYRSGMADDFFWLMSRGYPPEYKLPTIFRMPMLPSELPADDQGVKLALAIERSADPEQLVFMLTLSTGARPVCREIEHRWTNTLPFLFTFRIDGQTAIVPGPDSSMKLGGINQLIELVPAQGKRTWVLKVDEPGIRRLLPDSRPHVMEVTAAFSDRQHGQSALLDDLGFGSTMPYHAGDPRQVLVRSNTATLHWAANRVLPPGSTGQASAGRAQ